LRDNDFGGRDRVARATLGSGGEALLGLASERALGTSAAELGLEDALTGETPRLLNLTIPGRARRWELRRGAYRWEGRPYELLVLSDLTQSLREEERQAWQRLVRVLSHEINNSLAPIKSIAGSLKTSLVRAAVGAKPERETDPAARASLAEGLDVIESRSAALSRFIQAYARLARLPKPSLARMPVAAWVQRVAALETRGAVRIGWSVRAGEVTVRVEDDGPGLTDTDNLFIPFFTTKPGGSGIGLALCRQIAEAHGGAVTLENRGDARGCVVTATLPRVRGG
jgi:nitrogen fixation/metabolism regulation signal transduction histidine kinase